MQIWASVNEADVGRIQEAMDQAARRNKLVPVTFTIDGYPGETFKGEVAQIRLNASNTQNVVTYTVVVNTDNRGPDGKPGKLLPYMTANLQFEISKRNDVLLVSNAALRYNPPAARVHPDFRAEYEKRQKARTSAAAGEEPKAPAGSSLPRQQMNRGTLWVASGSFPKPGGGP